MKRLSKLGIHNIFDAILYVPKSYTNTFLIPALSRNAPQIGAVRVKITGFRRFPNVLKFEAKMLDFDEFLEITIFHPKPFHTKMFALNSEIYIIGKFEFSDTWRVTQPKITTSINQIIMNFPSKKLTSQNLNAILREVISLESMREAGIPESVAKRIWTIFHAESAPEFLSGFAQNGGLFGEYLEAVKFVEVFYYIKSLREKKSEFAAITRLSGECDKFVESLPFKLTRGQSEAIAFLREKLHSEKATRCVIMGDVGCGKTIVILACVMMAYPHKSVLFAPTTILAAQLYAEAVEFLPKNLKIALAMKDSEITECDFLIGTHTLLFRNLGDFALFMTDEQHRFGTNQRTKIEKMLSQNGKKPHTLQFSATPIPRTMALLESNLVDFCFIKDMPFPKNIATKIITKADFKDLIAHINAEISHNNQVAIIYPLVEKSDSIAYQSIEEGLGYWERRFSGVYSTHGKDKQKEAIIAEFRERGNLLVATTLFEVGISLPRLSTIIIVGAERLGFATLHQLRGRVSRNGLQGYCFLWTNSADSARLADFAKTTSGFEIAEIDLKYRSSGDVLRGIRQSGEQFKYFDAYKDREIAQNAMSALDEKA